MTDAGRQQSRRRERVLLTALLLSAPGPIALGIPAVISHSATQMADFVRRTAELVALFVAWWIFRRLQQLRATDSASRAHLERVASLTVAGALLCSGIAMAVAGAARLFTDKVSGNVLVGLVIAALGLLVNTWFWQRYQNMARERFDAVIAGQQRLYRAKVAVDLSVVTALALIVIAPAHPATRYIDALGCTIVAYYLLHNSLGMLRKNRAATAPVRRNRA